MSTVAFPSIFHVHEMIWMERQEAVAVALQPVVPDPPLM
jgi:hypothetical protein